MVACVVFISYQKLSTVIMIENKMWWNHLHFDPWIWPDLPSNQRSTEKNPFPKCVLLIQDTEMIVEPKTRQQKKNPSWSNPFRLIPSDFDWGVSLAKLSSLTGRDALHVDPGCVLVKTEEWPFETEWARIKSHDSDETRVVGIMTSPVVPRSSAGTSIASYFRIFYLDWIQIQFTPSMTTN